MIQRRPEWPGDAPVSSERIASSGKVARRRPRISASARWSISVTRFVGESLYVMRRAPETSSCSRRPATRAASTATRRSSDAMRCDFITRSLDNQRSVSEHGSMPDDARLTRRLSAGLGTRRRRGAHVRPGTPPGTLIAAGVPTPARISVLAYNREGATERRDVTVDDALVLTAPGGVTWINVDGLGDTQTLTRLGERFGLHPLALEDVLNVGQRPKVERYDKHLFVVMHTMRSAVWPMREEVTVLQRDESQLVTAETRLFLRDVYDHAVQALEIVESLRETAVSVMEVYLSVQNQRLNEVMKVLTVIATIFIPLTTIASIYGMNFKHMPELEWRYGYAWALGLMCASALGMLGYFKRRGWW